MKSQTRMAAALLLAAWLSAACGAGGNSSVASNSDLKTSNIDTSDQLFDPERLLHIDITMPAEDYEILRYEGRTLSDIATGCAAEFEYSNFEATVSIDGESYSRVDIRKKGFLGSLSAVRPSFRMNFGTHVPGREIYSMERLTLNNNRQDPGNTHQCLTYDLFRQAGLSAPRCNFAKVTMNGEDLGIYTNVEAVKKRFLRRNFEEDTGNLYESQAGGDFGENNKNQFQLKTNEEANDRSDLDAVVAALDADDENMPGMLNQVVDLDEFLSFWAMEGITGHWDSATGNANNYFVYNDPGDGRFHYIPWGADGSFELIHSLAPGTGPLFRYITIPARLYQIPEWRERYQERVLELLDALFDQEALNDEVDRIRDLTGTDEEDLVQVRNFIARQEQRVRDAISGELEQIERTIVDEAQVCSDVEPAIIEGSFNNGLASFSYEDREGILVTGAGLAQPISEESVIPIGDGLSMTVVAQSNEGSRLLLFSIETGELRKGVVPMHGVATTLFLIGEQPSAGFGAIGLVGEGNITFEEEPVVGETAVGTFRAELWLNDGNGNLFGGF